MSLTKWQEERFLDWVMEDEGDYCCCEVRFFKADFEQLKAWYRCPVCDDEWEIECPESVITYDPSDWLFEQARDCQSSRWQI